MDHFSADNVKSIIPKLARTYPILKLFENDILRMAVIKFSIIKLQEEFKNNLSSSCNLNGNYCTSKVAG